ncbi:MAG: hypothetical protein DCC68_01295 [Planctomycetota bacterium]|nr:MAG: hypothetical protein DCC68_01295 [Planctomycetota bacterium]
MARVIPTDIVLSRHDPLCGEFISLVAAGIYINKHAETIRRWIVRGVGGRQLPAVRIGGELQVHREELRSFLQSASKNAVATTAATASAVEQAPAAETQPIEHAESQESTETHGAHGAQFESAAG